MSSDRNNSKSSEDDRYSSFEWKISRKKRTQGTPEDEEPEKPFYLGVLISGNGSNLQALIKAIESNELPNVEIALVISNNARAYGIQRALKHNIPVIYVPWIGTHLSETTLSESETRLTSLLNLFQVDLIVLAGWMRILSSSFLAQFPEQVINLHPALLPDEVSSNTFITKDGTEIPVFRGLHTVRQALEAGIKVTGSTVHCVTPEVDAGPVIMREEVEIELGDTEESLHERLKKVEHRLIVEVVRRLSREN